MRAFLIALALAATSTASAQTAESDPYFAMIEARFDIAQDGVRIAETAGRGDAIISIPVTHRRTGVLREPIQFLGGLRNGAAYVPAGAHGYFAGDFGPEDGGAATPVWCFSAEPQNASASIECVTQSDDGWRVALQPSHKYLPVTFSLTPRGTRVSEPVIDEQPVTVHPDLRAEYILRGWNRRAANVELQLAGANLLAVGVYRPHPRGADGAALFDTPFSVLRLTEDGRRTRIERLPAAETPAN